MMPIARTDLSLPAIYDDQIRGHPDGNTWKMDLLNLANVKHGECFAFGGYGVDCTGTNTDVFVQRKIRCITDIDAATLNGCLFNK